MISWLEVNGTDHLDVAFPLIHAIRDSFLLKIHFELIVIKFWWRCGLMLIIEIIDLLLIFIADGFISKAD